MSCTGESTSESTQAAATSDWDSASEEEKPRFANGRTARAAQAQQEMGSSRYKMSLYLEMPTGQHEEIFIHRNTDGVGVHVLAYPMLKKVYARLSTEDLKILKPDGTPLQLDELVGVQLKDGDALRILACDDICSAAAGTPATVAVEEEDEEQDNAEEEEEESAPTAADAQPKGTPHHLSAVSTAPDGGMKAEFYIDGRQVEFKTARGLNIVTVDPTTFTVGSKATFDLEAEPFSANSDFATFIEDVPKGHIILAASKGSGMDQLSSDGSMTFQSIGMTLTSAHGCPIPGLGAGFAGIAVKGAPTAMRQRQGGAVMASSKLEVLADGTVLWQEVDDEALEEAMSRYILRFGKGTGEEEVEEEGIVAVRAGCEAVPSSKVSSREFEKLSSQQPKEVAEQGTKDEADTSYEPPERLNLTFGYAAGINEHPAFAHFDISDRACLYYGGFKHGEVVVDVESRKEFVVVGVKCAEDMPKPHLWLQPMDLGRRGTGVFPKSNAADLQLRLEHVDVEPQVLAETSIDDFSVAEDSDGEDMILCGKCHLPLGSDCFRLSEEDSTAMHGACMANCVLKEEKEREDAVQHGDKELIKAQRSKYDIGWKVQRIPRNVVPAKRLELRPLPQGMCCLMLHENDEGFASLNVSASIEPASNVNLEYLSIALQVRIDEGREPWFSLDPADPTDDHNTNLFKVFQPSWLAGTSVGEVLFQSDYHLKELSMGEGDQPVIGMKSVFDLDPNLERMHGAAREWFVVNDAEVQLTKDNVLLPRVEMGVEARAQFVNEDGDLEDAPVTSAEHPMVMYADQFTQNFDLIAERRGSIYHLRELAKASVLAKFLVESGVNVDCSLLQLASEKKPERHMEIPQLWSERLAYKIQLRNGQIKNCGGSVHKLCGGVQFGLEKFKLERPGGRVAYAGVASRPGLRSPLTARAARLAFAPSILRPEAGGAAPRGVDLNLNSFLLAEAVRVPGLPGWHGNDTDGSGACVAMGKAFIESLNGNGPAFKDGDAKLLKAVFNPLMTDRLNEGAQFVPPDSTASYVSKLRTLISEEERVRQMRKEHFYSTNFEINAAGPYFPADWNHGSMFDISCVQHGKGSAKSSMAHSRLDYMSDLPTIEHLLKSATPDFHKSTEDATKFRIYVFGSLEVRTTQDHNSKETIGAVFSISESDQCGKKEDRTNISVKDGEKIFKVTEYIATSRGGHRGQGTKSALRHYSYVVLETVTGNTIVTGLIDGAITWDENAQDLDYRTSLGRVIRSGECDDDLACRVADIKAIRNQRCREAEGFSRESKYYAQDVFDRANGKIPDPATTVSGFLRGPEVPAYDLRI